MARPIMGHAPISVQPTPARTSRIRRRRAPSYDDLAAKAPTCLCVRRPLAWLRAPSLAPGRWRVLVGGCFVDLVGRVHPTQVDVRLLELLHGFLEELLRRGGE